MKAYRYFLALLCSCTVFSCTNLDERLYDQVDSNNFYNTKTDIIRAVFRPFEHAYWSVQPRHVLQELTADIAKELVRNVVVYPGGRLDINLNYRDELEAMLKEAEAPIDAP